MLTTQQIMAVYERWLASPPAQPTLAEVSLFLETEYQARPLSLDVIPETVIVNDEELRPHFVAAVFTITDTATLLNSAKETHGTLEAYLQHLENERAEAAEYFCETGETAYNDWDFIENTNLRYDPNYADQYYLINVQLSLGQRINIVLEVEGLYVTSFKVSGSDPLSNHLNALIGYPEPTEDMGESIPRMKRGDLSDEMFVRYLINADKYGVI